MPSSDSYLCNLLSADAIDTLNAARTILKECADVVSRSSNVPDTEPVGNIISAGRIAQAADFAGDAVFDFLNTANAHADLRLSDTQLHNRPPARR